MIRNCTCCGESYSGHAYHLTRISGNTKTGPIPVSTTSDDSCPTSCPLRHDNKGGCYANGGPLAIHWKQLSRGDKGICLDCFTATIRKLPRGTIWRHDQAGDLPGRGNRVNGDALAALAAASNRTRGWTYTHKPLTQANVAAITEAIADGFTVNISADGLRDVDLPLEMGLPTVCVLPRDFAGKLATSPAGNRVVRCPATWNDTTCADCGNGDPLCYRPDRDYAIGFPAHGSGARKADEIANA